MALKGLGKLAFSNYWLSSNTVTSFVLCVLSDLEVLICYQNWYGKILRSSVQSKVQENSSFGE